MYLSGLQLTPEDDRDLERRIRIFLSGKHFPAMRLLHVDVESGCVSLRGNVPSYYQRQTAIECVKSVPGVMEVVDDVRVVEAPRPGLERNQVSVRQESDQTTLLSLAP